MIILLGSAQHALWQFFVVQAHLASLAFVQTAADVPGWHHGHLALCHACFQRPVCVCRALSVQPYFSQRTVLPLRQNVSL
jgi:hypothetical protein